MRAPTTALLWQIWRRNSQAAWLLTGITIVSWFTDVVQHGAGSAHRAGGPGPLNEGLAMLSFLLLFGIFSYTESSGDRGIGCFPQRLFTLPVSTLKLIAVPAVSGVVALELLYLAWMGRLTSGGSTSPWFVAVLLAAFMVFYQTALWTLTRLGALRLVALGAIGIALIGIGMLPSLEGSESSPWRSERFLGGAVAAAALAAFLFAWRYIARLRSGGERGAGPLDSLVASVVDRLPSRRGAFTSPSTAHFWYEWRSAGTVLPVLVGGLLLLVIAPVSWWSRGVAGGGMGPVLGALLAPIVLAVPVGMAFAKPTFWSEELAVPPFVAVRPVSAADIVAIKMRVAALATVISWLLTGVFLLSSLLLWGNEWLSLFAIQLWAVHGHSVLAVYLVAALIVVVGMFLTWRFLIVGVWAGLSGNRRLYVWSVTAVVLALIGYLVLGADRLPGWVLGDPTRMVPFVCGAAVAVMAKYWIAARTWRRAPPSLVWCYLGVWLAGTASCVALALMFWRVVRIYMAFDVDRAQSGLILLALLVMPIARVGLAPALLERNRHKP